MLIRYWQRLSNALSLLIQTHYPCSFNGVAINGKCQEYP